MTRHRAATYIPRMSVLQVGRTRPDSRWVGCVVRVAPGVLTVLTDAGEVRATLDGALLADVARDRTQLPAPGDWVHLRSWPDHRVTVLAAIRPAANSWAKVLPFPPR